MSVHSVRRVTDFPGLEEFPSISPDRRSVAFTASVNGRRQIFVRLIASGLPLQITRDAVDHQLPRWSPESTPGSGASIRTKPPPVRLPQR